MNQSDQPLAAFISLGKILSKIALAVERKNPAGLGSEAAVNCYYAAMQATEKNVWFTHMLIAKSLKSLAHMLREDAFNRWMEAYPRLKVGEVENKKKILVIMAGNIPLVGFHDMLCVLVSGHRLIAKLSSQDNILPVALGNLISELEPAYGARIEFCEGQARGFDAVIATGSNNSSRYFDYYFGTYPHIIRKNRTSLGILTGKETQAELRVLGDDVFAYFGLGCRNVSMLFLADDFDIQSLKESWQDFEWLSSHAKYMNNHDYQRAVLLVNKSVYTDTGFCLLKPDTHLHSPISVVHYQTYSQTSQITDFIAMHHDELQCIVANPALLPDLSSEAALPGNTLAFPLTPFGSAHKPELWDYADGVDTMQFLLTLGGPA